MSLHMAVCAGRGFENRFRSFPRVLSWIRPLISFVLSFKTFERQLLISIVSGFPKALEGYAMYNTRKQEICSHLSYGFFFFSSKSLVIVSQGTLCKSCSASYNIAINIANNNFRIYRRHWKSAAFCRKD